MKILVVDDDRRIVKTTCDILKIKGYEPIAAYSGEEAVEKVRNDPPDCVLMDIKMTGINGVEALKQMQEIVPALPVVLVSAYATNDLMEEAKHAGAYAILSKPLNFPIILSFLSLLRQEESILIVDDDPNFCKTLKDILTMRGIKVETESDPAKPVVLVTGYREKMANSIEKARIIGAYTCLYKPLEMDDLVQLIEEIRIKKLQNLLVSG